jgi:predicted AlkP superfamily pyrophosphatase or phosphodiesterase
MNRSISILVCFLFIFSAQAQENKTIKRPKLVVGIVVDQMRWDYLYRFYDRFTEGGFKRLMNEGYNCQNTFINYLPSYTGPGHATIYTGSVPAIHGIASNDWIDNATGKTVYCVEDKTVQAVGGSSKAGQMSPRNLLTTTVTDELRLVNGMSQVCAISLKDRGAILPGGHTIANNPSCGAFWFDDSTGNFMSSNYYWTSPPEWIQQFNNKRYTDTLINKEWNKLYDRYSYQTTTNGYLDNNMYEGKFNGEQYPTFPHKLSKTSEKGYNGLRCLPGGNKIIFQLAKQAVVFGSIGFSFSTDFLCLSFSATDYVGHMYGPNSHEVEDMYLRFDKDLASFLHFLDLNIGEGNYTVFLTADHGAAHNSEFLKDNNIPAGNKSETEAAKELMSYIKSTTGKDSLIRSLSDYQVYLNEPKFISTQQREDVKKLIVDWFYKQDGVAFAIDMEHMQNENIPEPIKTMIVNGYNKQRSGCIQIILQPAWYSDSHKTGTTHGTWNPYDTHIPLLWYGWGIPKGETHRRVNMTDIAATLSALLHIQMPNGCVGSVITEITD